MKEQYPLSFLVIYADIAIKSANFFKFDPTSSVSILSNRRQETVAIPKCSLKERNWIIIFEIQLMRRPVSFLTEIK